MDKPEVAHDRRGWLTVLGLHSPALRAWVLYDWAVSGWQTTILTALFPVYYYEVAGAGLPPGAATSRFAAAAALSVALVALAAPVLGALADRAAARKKILGALVVLGVLATAGMALIDRGNLVLATVLFVASYMCASGSLVFYDALLPHVAHPHEMDRVSTVGHALGYLGGGLLLALNLAWIAWPGLFWIATDDPTAPARLAFLSVAAWWLVFSIPLFLKVAEPAPAPFEGQTERGPTQAALGQLGRSLRSVLGHRPAAFMLAAFLCYQAGIETLLKMATIFGKEVGLDDRALLATILLVQFVGIPCAVMFGLLADRIGAKRSILIALGVYAVAGSLAYFLTNLSQFVVLALLVAFVRGGCQALSRSLFARLVPAQESAAAFGLFAVAEKLAGTLGPGTFAIVVAATGSSRQAVGALVWFFVLGGAVLSRVKVESRQVMRPK